MAEADTCEHDWDWLTGIHLVRDWGGNVTEYHNAYCTICGLRIWAHGWLPIRHTIEPAPQPTTGRS